MNRFVKFHIHYYYPALLFLLFASLPAMAGTVAQSPLFLGQVSTPLIMLTMDRDHKLYFEAYNDASDINGDGELDIRFNPTINYFGYFDSYKCYTYGSNVFTPAAITTTKTCSGQWSGNFLNYLTMSRMDALRRVLYGGYRSTDSTTETILERSHIPQDAHSWGKEYTSTTVDGFAIEDYAPLSQPVTGTHHLFANTTLLCPNGNGGVTDVSSAKDPGCNITNNPNPKNTNLPSLPLLRVLTNTTYRVWEWLTVERPVAGVLCATGSNVRDTCIVEASGSATWSIVPTSYLWGLTQTTYYTGGYSQKYPNTYGDFNNLVSAYTTDLRLFGSTSASQINGTGNPNHNPTVTSRYSIKNDQNNYLTLFSGSFVVPTGEGGTYTFAVDGDDAVDVLIDGTVVAGYYGPHGKCNCQTYLGSVSLAAGSHTLLFRHQEFDGDDSYYLYWKRTPPTSTMTDYVVRVKACVNDLRESECRGYPANSPSIYKPSGILQEYGENNRMAFGLLTGSFTKNVSGGVLRKNMSYLADSSCLSTDTTCINNREINQDNGIFNTPPASPPETYGNIINTINLMRTVGFGPYPSSGNIDSNNTYNYYQNCGVPEVAEPLAEGRCRMWGNPVAEMMYETTRFFAGKTLPTTEYSSGVNISGTDDKTLNLRQPDWTNPYRTTSGGFPSCSKPSQIVISDINPSYDTDLLPGRNSYTKPSATLSLNPAAGDLIGLSDQAGQRVQDLAQSIWAGETEASTVFIGQSGDNYDSAPTAKPVAGFGTMRGLSPEEPTKQGGYYAASVALFAKTNDLNAASGNQKTDTFVVALASPMPRIQLPVNGRIVTLVAFGKTVGGCGNLTNSTYRAKGLFQPTNGIVDFYVDHINNTGIHDIDTTVNGGRAYAKFRINFEDSEYGSDFDMDAIVEYELTAKLDGNLEVKLNSNYAAGGCIQHMGYVISGTTADGSYLEVRDMDTASGSDVDYFLDTPNVTGALPTTTTRIFTPGSTSAAFVKHDPLWYAAKWGGFLDTNYNNMLDTGEWDSDFDGVPDSYFLVTNASKLKDQLDKVFTEIVRRNSSSSSVATNSTSVGTDTLIYQARFNSGDWSGQIRAYHLNTDGSIGTLAWDTNTSGKIPPVATRKVYSYNPSATGTKGVAFCWDATNCFAGATSFLNTAQKTILGNVDMVNYLRGDQGKETKNHVGTYRDRAVLLGDIVNSDPWFVGTQSFDYEILPDPEGLGYINLRASTAYRNRRNMLYVAANDGMLHGFDSATGVEQFAYLPNAVINSSLLSLAAQGYTHKYLLDGSPRVGDAYFASSWHTVLVGTTGAGGKAVFALDVTNPDSFSASNVLWEFTSVNDTDLGVTIPLTAIARMKNGQWASIISNGYESTSGKAVLFIINLQDGSLIKKIDTCPTTPCPTANGLSAAIPVDVNNDRITDYIYAGDLYGNLWKFDVSSSDKANWGVAYSGLPLYVAKDKETTAVTQPITIKPQVGRATAAAQNTGVMVYFGTGKYYETSDTAVTTGTQVSSFYGIWDKCDIFTTNCDGHFTGRTSLQAQTILAEGTTCLVNTSTNACSSSNTSSAVRVTSNNAVDYSTTPVTVNNNKKGWFMDFVKPPNATVEGERVVSTPILREDLIIFPTLIPSSDACAYGGTSWLMELQPTTGKRSENTPFNFNPTGIANIGSNVKFSDSSKAVQAAMGVTVAVSGLQSGIGIIKTPTIISINTGGGQSGGGAAQFGLEVKCFSGSSGELQCLQETRSDHTGRLSWRQRR